MKVLKGPRSLIPALLGFCLAAISVPGQTLTKDEYISQMDAALDTIITRTDASRQTPLLFSANLFYAHEALITSVPLGLLQAYVDTFREAGVHRVDFNPGTWPWLVGDNDAAAAAANRAKYDALVNYIRGAGLQLNINPIYTSTHNVFTSFDEWKAAAIPVWVEIAKRYKPDTLVVIHEPTTMNERLKLDAGPAEWRSFVEDAARAIKAVAPRTRLGVGFLFYEIDYLRAVLPIPEIDGVTIDIYSLGRFSLLANDFTHLAVYEQMVNMAQAAGKTIYLEETWRPSFIESPGSGPPTLDERSAVGVGDQAFEPIDAKWLTAIAQQAAVWGLEAMTPFWTQTFFYYAGPNESNGALDGEYNQKVGDAIAALKRTPTFEAFQAVTGRLSAKHLTVNSGSFIAGPAAAGSIVSVFPFGGASLADRSADATTIPLPTHLAGSEIMVTDRNGAQRLAPLISVRPGQINYILPAGLPDGPAAIDVRLDSGPTLAGSIQVARTGPGIYTANQNGEGVAAGYVIRVRSDGSQNTEPISQPDFGSPPRQIPVPVDLGPDTDQVQLVLFGTGIRQGTSVSVRIGGENAVITYAGDQKQFVGLDQVQVVLPRSLIGRGEVPIRLQVDEKLANTVTISIR